jgi:hypothetical protein
MIILLQIYEPFQYASRTVTVLLKYGTVRGNSAPSSSSLPYPKATVTRREERSKGLPKPKTAVAIGVLGETLQAEVLDGKVLLVLT